MRVSGHAAGLVPGLVLAMAVAATSIGVASPAQARETWPFGGHRAKQPSPTTPGAAPPAVDQGLAQVPLGQLPAAARWTYRRILAGGPFYYDKDGSVFGNRERLLPAAPRGHYREYTVTARAQRSRGARRIICGGDEPARPQACFYSDDHYASFRQIVP